MTEQQRDEQIEAVAMRAENERLRNTLDIHAGDCMSLNNEIEQSMAEIASLRQDIDNLQAAFAGKWLPIEDAPRDGTEILGLWSSGEQQVCWCSNEADDPYWWCGTDESPAIFWRPRLCPTHWMPLPEPSVGDARDDASSLAAQSP